MSTWRQKAIECAPAQKREFEDSGTTVYEVFMALLVLVRAAHIHKDYEQLEKIYAYAAWCTRQKATDLWNAAGVCFYEHLGDDDVVFAGFTQWVKKDIYFTVRNLLCHRLGDDKIKMLDRHYGWRG